MINLNLSYYPDITQKQSDEDVRGAIKQFSSVLESNLSKKIAVEVSVTTLPVMSVSEQFNDLLAGNHHIALMKPVAYVFAHNRNPKILPACVAHRPIDGNVGTDYFAQVYARRELGITTLSELSEIAPGTLRMAYGDRFSTSNFLIPANILSKNRINPFLFFKSVEFFGGHDFAAEAVYHGNADIGGGHDGVIKILSETQPDAEDKLIRLEREFIHSDPVVINTSALPKGVDFELIQASCSEIAKTKPVQDALDLFWGWVKDLSPTKHSNYRSIEEALERLNLNEDDMLS